MTTVINEMELIAHLDFDIEEPCDLGNDCENPADYRVYMNCCDNAYLFCEFHYESLLIVMEMGEISRCNFCDARGITIDRVVPIKKS